MCGLNGILRLSPAAPPPDRDELIRTRDTMASRGPDGAGEWLSPSGEIALGHRRLSIIDLSEAGAQPMAAADGRYRIVFNGEIYNYRELRQELAGQGEAFRSWSDTEVILALYAREKAGMLARLRGMYALAIWDGAEKTLFLARDPYGIKPLYYSLAGGVFRFASQVKALEASGAVSREEDPGALAGFLLWGSIPEPLTIRRAIRALPAGHCLTVSAAGTGDAVEPRPFQGAPAPAPGLEAGEAIEDSVRAHLVADVPVGLFLSAGLDSALIAALARRQLPEPPATFTLTFDRFQGTPRDEGPLAAEIARRLGCRHVERRVGRDEFLELWPQALAAMDQPSIDGFNTFVVARLAREAGFKVALSGLGGDEILGSYPSFRDVPRWARAAALGRAVSGIPGLPGLWAAVARLALPGRPKLAGLLRYAHGLSGAYFLRRGLFLPEELPALLGSGRAAEGLAAYDPLADAAAEIRPGDTAWTAVHRLESGQYLRNQLLRDADWASMASSLELRVPLVDARLRTALEAVRFEPARSQGKAALVHQVAPELPAALFTRRKTGFAIPVMDFLDVAGGRSGGGGASDGADSRRLALRLLKGMGISC